LNLKNRFKELRAYEREQEHKIIQEIEASNKKLKLLEPRVKRICKQFSKSVRWKIEIRKWALSHRIRFKRINEIILYIYISFERPFDKRKGSIFIRVEKGLVSIEGIEYADAWDTGSPVSDTSITFDEFTEERLSMCLEEAFHRLVG
jgi:hypothetical protein